MVTEYVVVASGVTVIAAVAAPVDQLYVRPGGAVSVVLMPLQSDRLPVITVPGTGLTVTVLEALLVQPLECVTVTE